MNSLNKPIAENSVFRVFTFKFVITENLFQVHCFNSFFRWNYIPRGREILKNSQFPLGKVDDLAVVNFLLSKQVDSQGEVAFDGQGGLVPTA